MYNHDISHCNGGGGMCPRKDTCYRYLAYQEAQKSGMIVPIVSPIYGENRCVFYIEHIV